MLRRTNLFTAILVPAKANPPVLTASTSSSISLRWNPVREGSLSRTYIISWNSTSSKSIGSGNAEETTFTATNLQSNTAYKFTVTARSKAGTGLPSNEVIFKTGKPLLNKKVC